MANIGFIGTGIMGQPMAANLQKAGHNCSCPNTTAKPHKR
jgi:3-hydroxyisobutyrate dehydrogenase-like beta-hydroxyacid dehydrogenase